VRDAVTALAADHGGYFGTAFLDVWSFDLTGWFLVDAAADVAAAFDYLRSKVNVYKGAQVVTFNHPGWSASRQMTLRVSGQVSMAEVERGENKLTSRTVTIPVTAADPRLYATTAQAVTVGTGGTSLTNSGTVDAPFTVRFNGPQTDPQIDGPGTAGLNRIKYTGSITSGHYVDVTTLDAASGVMIAVDDTGANVFGSLANGTARTINPGTSTWTKSNASGAGTTVVTFRDAWG
jgi:hypothetical protein